MTMNDSDDKKWYNEWQWVIISANFLFFREETTNVNPLNLEVDLEEDLLN